MAEIMDGKLVSRKIREAVRMEVKAVSDLGVPRLDVILVGDDPASKVYVTQKKKTADRVGIESRTHNLSGDVTEKELLDLIRVLNNEPATSGILVQLPLPPHIDERRIIEAIDPRKDVDGFHPLNMGKMLVGAPFLLPCTPSGVMELLHHYGIDPAGKKAVIVGRSNIVGKPMAVLLLNANATVEICHSKTADLAEETSTADIVVVAVGKPEMVSGDMIKEGAVVIDVGVNRTEKGLVGDVEFDSASEKASYITPVPGGVGPMTVAMLMRNTLNAFKIQNGLQ